ncbi:MAG: hypothetical protein Q8S17_09540 [Humidesulfovibrio sp.]|nr:hypothetical protein [Humidesulfovibrio sp.]
MAFASDRGGKIQWSAAQKNLFYHALDIRRYPTGRAASSFAEEMPPPLQAARKM